MCLCLVFINFQIKKHSYLHLKTSDIYYSKIIYAPHFKRHPNEISIAFIFPSHLVQDRIFLSVIYFLHPWWITPHFNTIQQVTKGMCTVNSKNCLSIQYSTYPFTKLKELSIQGFCSIWSSHKFLKVLPFRIHLLKTPAHWHWKYNAGTIWMQYTWLIKLQFSVWIKIYPQEWKYYYPLPSFNYKNVTSFIYFPQFNKQLWNMSI